MFLFAIQYTANLVVVAVRQRDRKQGRHCYASAAAKPARAAGHGWPLMANETNLKPKAGRLTRHWHTSTKPMQHRTVVHGVPTPPTKHSHTAPGPLPGTASKNGGCVYRHPEGGAGGGTARARLKQRVTECREVTPYPWRNPAGFATTAQARGLL